MTSPVLLVAALATADMVAEPLDGGNKSIVSVLAVTLDDPLAARLDAELGALGLEPRLTAIPIDGSIEDAVGDALTGGARAVLIADGQRVEIWIPDAGPDRIVLRREIEILKGEDVGLESVLALRAVELVRVAIGLTGPRASPASILTRVDYRTPDRANRPHRHRQGRTRANRTRSVGGSPD